MPRRRKISAVLVNKKKKVIESRLMEINLELEGYIFRQKLITNESAKAYIEEITTYKETCHGDARSLQVIEKLTRCMQGIIKEQTDETKEVQNFSHEENISEKRQVTASPVYSTVDEDLTQLEDIDSNMLVENEIEDVLMDLAQDMSDTVSIFNTQEGIEHQNNKLAMVISEEIDLADKQNTEVNEPVFDIQSAISGLTIMDFEESMDVANLLPESQSILGNLESAYNGIRNSNLLLTQEVLQPVTFTKEPDQEMESISQKPTQKKRPRQKKMKALNINPKMFDIPNDAGNTTILKPRNIKGKTKDKSTTDSSEPGKTEARKRKAITKKVNHKLKTNADKDKKEIQNEEIHIRTQKQIQSNINTFNNAIMEPNKNIYDKDTNEPNVPDAYNKNLVTDLSWVENIRYVREICTEFESCTVDEGFWDNYTLAGISSEDFN